MKKRITLTKSEKNEVPCKKDSLLFCVSSPKTLKSSSPNTLQRKISAQY